MYFLLCVFCLLSVHSLAEENKVTCVTPHNEAGECVLITSCPTLLDAFANPINGSEKDLLKFRCTNKEASKHTFYYMQDIFVCCGVSPNFTIFENTSTLNSAEDLTKLSDTRYCGFQQKDDFQSINDDNSITINEFPWVAQILGKLNDQENASLCSGTLINNKHVLTSAHCVLSVPLWSSVPYRILFVRLGEFDKKNTTDCVDLPQFNVEECSTHEDYGVAYTVPHPFYNLKSGMNNILLIKLKKTVTYSDYIRPICLPIPGTTFAQPNDTLDISAVGSQWDFMTRTTLKMKTNASLITNGKCEESLSHYHKLAPSNLICTAKLFNETSPLQYEGAPLMFSHKHQWHIEGIMVNHDFCLVSQACVYTRVSKYLRWIQYGIRS